MSTPLSADDPSAKIAIKAESLTKIYGAGNTEVVAMRDASMTVMAGEVVALLGPSGSGKSTFLTAVGLINPPTSGKIYIANQLIMDGPQALTNLRSFRRKHLGFVFQKSSNSWYTRSIGKPIILVKVPSIREILQRPIHS